VCLLAAAAPASAATPDGGTLSPDASGKGEITWKGAVNPGTATASDANACFDANKKPDPASGCDFYKLDVNVPDRFYDGFLGGVQIDVSEMAGDLDLGIYARNLDGTRGDRVGGSGQGPGIPEQATLTHGAGAYWIVVTPFTVTPNYTYNAKASFVTKKANPTLTQLNANAALLGPENFRASHDQYTSHSEPSIAMDPLNHDHLVAGSKQYESLAKYFFKIGTYESFDGGRTWKDWGFLPGYCLLDNGTTPHSQYCDVNNDTEYRVVSDVATAFDDEGNAYVDVLDAPGGATSTGGWNNNVHIKRPGQPWTGPITVHSNRDNPISQQTFLDDKNWIAVDNHTTVDGKPNKPGDGKIGTMYVCWSFDEGAVGVGQSIGLMKSTDGGKTWGGHTPGDNTPYLLSQKGAVSGIGCHIVIGPQGEVYVTWYDNQLDDIMQVKSTDRGATFTPQRPIAKIVGVNQPFSGQSFRNLSIPTTGIDSKGTVYVVASSSNGQGGPPVPAISVDKPALNHPSTPHGPVQEAAAGDQPPHADIVLFKSTDGGQTYTGPLKVNQDTGPSDHFQPWLSVTDSGQLDVMYFDRRHDPNNYFIQTWLSRSNDGGKTFTDVPVGHMFWDPAVNPPISPSGQFIGDYQGIAADDDVAIPFWNDTQANNLARTDPSFSPWQEVWAARIYNTQAMGGPAPGAAPGREGARNGGRGCLPRRLRLGSRGLGSQLLVGAMQSVLRTRVPPSAESGLAWRYCVVGGGSVLVAFAPNQKAQLVASTARGHAARRIHRGSTIRALRRKFHGLRRPKGRRYFVSRSKRLVFGTSRRRVAWVAVADRKLVKDPSLLSVYLERVGLARTKRPATRR
jgi:hypothetical protein